MELLHPAPAFHSSRRHLVQETLTSSSGGAANKVGRQLSYGSSVRPLRERWLENALKTAEILQQQGNPICADYAYWVLQECNTHLNLDSGRRMQSLMAQSALDLNILSDPLIRLFALCGSLVEANDVFNKVRSPTNFTWSCIITLHAKLGQSTTFLLYDRMLLFQVGISKHIYFAIIKTCQLKLTYGRVIHEHAIMSDAYSYIALQNTLIDMYAKCGSMGEASKMFDALSMRDVVSWSAMIYGHAHCGENFTALHYFESMQNQDIRPNKVTFLNTLKACNDVIFLRWGRYIHEKIIEYGFQSDVSVGSMLVNMYGNCKSVEEAWQVLMNLQNRNVVSWSAMISGYAKHGRGFLALKCFKDMQKEGIRPDKFAYTSALQACGSIGAIDEGRYIHQHFVKSGINYDVYMGNALMDMYLKCGSLAEARKIFYKLPVRDVISWSLMIAGQSQHSESCRAFECFECMQNEGLEPNSVTMSSILTACGCIGAVEQGRKIHEQVINSRLQLYPYLGNALVDMYAKCGSLSEAKNVLTNLPKRDVISWDAMITGCAHVGDLKLVKQCFEGMQLEGVGPSEVTFTSILSACSHVGLVHEGLQYFKQMKEVYGIKPSIYHYNCFIDLLSRAGYLNEAESILQTIKPQFIGWITLLTACRTYCNIELGRRCFNQIVQLDQMHAAAYVLMSGIYADAHMWEYASKVESQRQRANAIKKPAKVWIEVSNKVTEFIVGDKTHAQNNEICAMLEKLKTRMEEAGYTPKVDLVLQKMSDTEKGNVLCGHSEKMAIAFGIINTPPGTTIRATKNLRVCMDCHSATKIISKIEGREIIIRDAYRMHHFKEGSCSCGDYY